MITRTAASTKKRADPTPAERRVNRLLRQLIAAALIFLLVFVGGGIIPARLVDVRAGVHDVISGDSRLLDTVAALGSAVAEGESVPRALVDWCQAVFAPADGAQSSERYLQTAQTYHAHLLPALPGGGK